MAWADGFDPRSPCSKEHGAISGPTPVDVARRSAGSPRSDGASEVRSKEDPGPRTLRVAREPSEASGRREPSRCRVACGTGDHGVNRDRAALIFENSIVDCRDRSIRIEVINGP